MTRVSRIHARCFAAGLYATIGDPFRFNDAILSAVDLLIPSPQWSGGVGAGGWS